MKTLKQAYNDFFDQKFNVDVEPVYDNKVQSILKYVDHNKQVLDVGCLTGYLGYFCLKKKNSTKVVGIDFVENALKHARKLGIDARYGNVENGSLPIQDSERFDVIIVSEIIEHLVDPLVVLEKLKKVLKKNGKIIISTPNMAYFQYRFELLMGKLPDFCEFRGKYPERPYNFQHKTLFTKKVLVETLEMAELKLKKLDSHSTYKSKLEKFFDPFEKLFPGVFVKNMIAVVTKKD